jgi:antitoxin component of MazEF toxin-antitoxin module
MHDRGCVPITPAADVHVYTCVMKIVKVRRVGNSNVVSLPREFEASGYAPGASVLVEELADGELRILPTDKVRQQVRQIADRVVSQHPEAIKILAEHAPDDGA